MSENIGTTVAQRIALLIESSGLKVGDFAEQVGIQKSAVSHLIGGRNKPSFEVIGSMLTAFPALSPDWLILGKGTMWRKETTAHSTPHIPTALPTTSSLKDLAKTGIKDVQPSPLIEHSENTEQDSLDRITNSTKITSVTEDPSHSRLSVTSIGSTNDNDCVQTEQITQSNVLNHSAPPEHSTNKNTVVANVLPDLVVLLPDGRYVRYRAIEK